MVLNEIEFNGLKLRIERSGHHFYLFAPTRIDVFRDGEPVQPCYAPCYAGRDDYAWYLSIPGQYSVRFGDKEQELTEVNNYLK